MMADCWGRLTGEPGICMVTRGPGATNASAGPAHRRQDSIPMILFIGQVQREAREREAFQEIEYRRAFTEVAKWVAEIDDPQRIPEFVTRAFAVATSGRPGPVVLALPEDMLTETVEAPAARPYTPVEAHPGPTQIAQLTDAAGAGRTAGRRPRRHALERGKRRRHHGLRRALGAAGCLLVPPADAVRPPAPELCGRFRHRHQPGARPRRSARPISSSCSAAAIRRCRPPATRCSTAPTRSRRWCMSIPIRPSSAASTGPMLAICASASDFVAGLADLAPAAPPRWAERTNGHARGLSRLVDAADDRPRRRADGTDHDLARGERAGGCDLHQWRRQLRHLGAPLPPLPALRHAGRADLRLDGLRPAGGGGRQAVVPASGRSSALPATAAS